MTPSKCSKLTPRAEGYVLSIALQASHGSIETDLRRDERVYQGGKETGEADGHSGMPGHQSL